MNERVADNSMRRTVRKLDVPGAVSVVIKGPTTRNTVTLLRSDDGGESWSELGERIGAITALAVK